MALRVSDSLSHNPRQIDTAAELIGSSKYKRAVFERVCFGKRKTVSIAQIVLETNLPRRQLMNAANFLADNGIIEQPKEHVTTYLKNCTLCNQRKKILSMAGNETKKDRFRKKFFQKENKTVIKIYNRKNVTISPISIDDIDEFNKIKNTPNQNYMNLKEDIVKKKLIKILREKGKYKDWGGEFYDLGTWIKINGKRLRAVFALKGRGKKITKLRLKDMGTNGDQIDRMFMASAQVFFVQFVGQVGEDIFVSLENNAKAKSFATGQKIYYGVIDGNDTARIFKTFPN